MNNKVYFMESKPGVFERNARFKLKSNVDFVPDIQYREINSFGWRVCEKINKNKNSSIKIWSKHV